MDVKLSKMLLNIKNINFNSLTSKEKLSILRSHYYKAVRKFHPDLNSGSTKSADEMTKKINSAFDFLCQHYNLNANSNKNEKQNTTKQENRSSTKQENGFFYYYQEDFYDGYHNPEGSWDKFWKEHERRSHLDLRKANWHEFAEEYNRIKNIHQKEKELLEQKSSQKRSRKEKRSQREK